MYHDEFLGEPVPVQATLFDADEIAAALRTAGFTVDAIEDRPPYEFEYPSRRIYVVATIAA